MNSDAAGSFDRLLEGELHRALGNLEGPSPDVRQSSYQAKFLAGRRSHSRRSAIRLFLSGRLVLVLAVTALLLVGGSIATAASSGSLRPDVWGRAITTAIEECKDQLGGGQDGIGECVSAAAKERGEGQPGSHPHAASPSHASGAAAGELVGPEAHPSPSAQVDPTAISGTGPERATPPEALASNGRKSGQAPNQTGGPSKSPGPSKSTAKSKSHNASGQPGNSGSGKSKSGGSGKSANEGSGKSGKGGGGNSKIHAPASPSPSP